MKNFAPGLFNKSESKVNGWEARVSHCNDFFHCSCACRSQFQTSFYLENSRVTWYDFFWEWVTCSALPCSSFCNLISWYKNEIAIASIFLHLIYDINTSKCVILMASSWYPDYIIQLLNSLTNCRILAKIQQIQCLFWF